MQEKLQEYQKRFENWLTLRNYGATTHTILSVRFHQEKTNQ